MGEWLKSGIPTQWNMIQQLKGSELLVYATIWMDFNNTTLSEKSQSQKVIHYMIPFI